jgi:4-hydroxy-tetrahydrodipicolinate synthase
VAAAKGRLAIAVQVSDNSSDRILDNIAAAKEDGADMAVIAPPSFLMNATPANIERLYLEAIEASTIPIGIYDRGRHGAVLVPDGVLKTIYAHPRVVAVKDSSADPKRRAIALAVRKKRPELRLLNGDEFHCDEYIAAGYDGLMLGGGIFNGLLAAQILEAARAGDNARAHALQERMNKIMFAIYGGPKIQCWLTGLKKYLVEIGVFATTESFLRFPLTPSCEKAIARVIKQDADVLLP